MKNISYQRYLFIPGIVLAIAAITARIITGAWTPVYIGLLLVGIFIIWFWFFNFTKKFWLQPATQATTYAFTTTILMIVFLGLINYLTVRYLPQFDLTENQILSLSEQSQQLLEKVNKPIKLWIFTLEPSSDDRQLLETYRRSNPNFTFEFVDPQLRPALAQQFNVQVPGEVYLEYEGKKQLIQTLAPGANITEAKLSTGIERIQRHSLATIYFLQGHQEAPLIGEEVGISQAVKALDAKGYQVQPLNLSQVGGVPPNADVVVIAGPKRSLLPKEVQSLQDYLKGRGRILLMVDPNSNTGLAPLLKDWGISVDNRVIIDASGAGDFLGFGPASTVVVKYGTHPITKDLSNGMSVYPLSTPVNIQSVSSVQVTPLLMTSNNSWAESNLESDKLTFDPKSDRSGPLELGVALQRGDARLIVIGNSTFVTNGWFEQQLNGDIFLNSLSWLIDDNQTTITIRPREPQNRRINLTALQGGAIAWLSLVVFPVFGFIAAFTVWWRQR